MRIATSTEFTGFRVQRLEWSGGTFVNIHATGGAEDARIELLTAAEARALGRAAAEAERLFTEAPGGGGQ